MLVALLVILATNAPRVAAQELPSERVSAAGRLAGGGYVAVDLVVDPPAAEVRVSSLEPDESVRGSRRVHLAPRRHDLVMTCPGYRARPLALEVRAGEPLQVAVTLEREARASRPALAERRGGPLVPATAGPVRTTAGSPWPWVALAAGAAFGGAGAFLHVEALNARSAAEGLPAGPAFDDRLAEFERLRAATLGAYAVGVVTIGVGAWLLLDDRPIPRRRFRSHLFGAAGAGPGSLGARLGWNL